MRPNKCRPTPGWQDPCSAAPTSTPATATQGPRTDVTLTVDAFDPTTASDPDGVPLADGTTRTLLCDPDLHALIIDSLGVPLDLGRKSRYANRAQRRRAPGGRTRAAQDRHAGTTTT